MKLLLVGAGATFSVKDVETGLYDALLAAGVDVRLYDLDQRIGTALSWLKALWRARGRQPDRHPTWPDAIYRGSIEALEMALRYDVDWVVAVSGMFLHPDALQLMRRAGLRTAVVFTESPYDDEKQARVAELVDVCWTHERASVAYLRQFNPRTFYLRHAYDPRRHTPLQQVNADVPSHDVVFVGSGFQERIDMLAGADWSGIDLGLYGVWSLLPSRHRLRQHIRGGLVNNIDAAALYRQARIGLNLYRTSRQYARNPSHIEHAHSLNPRAYELAACGVFQISDYRPEVNETFLESVPTFRTPDRLEELVRGRLPDVQGLRQSAVEARHLVEPHTFAARAAQLLADLASVGAERIAKGA